MSGFSMGGQSARQLVPQGALSLGVLGLIGVMVVPIPALLLDGLLGLSVAASLLVLLVGLAITRPLDFSVFPTLLLIVTLLRLSLNVSTTRLILLKGDQGPEAVSRIIGAFGSFAAGGSLVVGAVIFLVIIIINFVVITKGAGRVAEVSARFTLDALPGKQMSIDADLAAGVITDVEARRRRTELSRESEFFGSMDGASKFVRGDAVAGLVITGINIVGGLAMGMGVHGMSAGEALETYTILTMGDGLVSQIPSLLVSVAAGIVVTRAGSQGSLGGEMVSQVLGRPEVMIAAAVVLALMPLLPGMPLMVFLALAAGAFLLARRAGKLGDAPSTAASKPEDPEQEERVEELLALDAVEMDLGYALLPLIEVDSGGELPGRITSLRKSLAQETGVVLPPVHLRDDLRLEANVYRLLLRGQEIARGQAWADRLMVLDPGGGTPPIDGIPATEPAFGLAARWIETERRAEADSLGLTVVDAASVLTTHLSELLKKHGHELVGRDEVQGMLARIGREAPKLVEEVIPAALSVGELVQVIRRLVEERVSVRDLRTILEAIGDAANRSKEIPYLTERVRRRMNRQISSMVSDKGSELHILSLSRAVEELVRASLGQQDGEPVIAPELVLAQHLISEVQAGISRLANGGKQPVLLAAPDLRRPLFTFLIRFVPDLFVVSAQELTPGIALEVVHTVTPPPQLSATAA